jgi:hypothetical protein
VPVDQGGGQDGHGTRAPPRYGRGCWVCGGVGWGAGVGCSGIGVYVWYIDGHGTRAPARYGAVCGRVKGGQGCGGGVVMCLEVSGV